MQKQRIKSRCDNKSMMVALRVFFRAGWQIANPVNRVNSNNETRYPFAVLKPAAAAAPVVDPGAGS